jgi:hypothetical protein
MPATRPGSLPKERLADDDVVRVGVHVAHRRKVQIEAVLLEIRADGLSHISGVFKIPCGAYVGHALVFRHIEALGIGDAGYAAALLVDTHERGDGAGVLQPGYKTGQLGGSGYVLAEDGEAPGRVLLQHGFMSSVSAVTPYFEASLICSSVRDVSSESGRIINSWPTFSLVDMPSSSF